MGLIYDCGVVCWGEAKNEVKKLTDINFGVGFFSKEAPELFLSRYVDERLVGFLSYSRGTLSAVIVAKEFRRQGVGDSLVKELVSKENGDIEAFCWVNDGVVELKTVLVKHGFKEGELLREFWHGDSIRFNFSCINCGYPCRCDAILFERKKISSL